MSTYSLNTTVSRQEAEALKEMIFKRARERAQALIEETQNSYTKSAQTDIMDMARDSFVSIKNPFSQKETITENNVENQRDAEIGFAKRQISEIKKQIDLKNNVANTVAKYKEVESTMDDARADLGKKPAFIGALEFLNSQATIALVKNKGQQFEALA